MFVSLAHAVCLSKIKLEKAQLNKIRHIYSNETFIISNLVRTTRFWNNFHRVRSKAKIFESLSEQEDHRDYPESVAVPYS